MRFFQALIVFYILSAIIHTLSAQSVKNIKAEIDKINRRINITYDLHSKNKYDKYNIEVYVSRDSGKTFKHRLEYVTGKVGKGISPGVGKAIQWLFLKEDPFFDGKNVVFKIRTTLDIDAQRRRTMSLEGPEATWRSAVFPGWGDKKVNGMKNFWIIGASCYSLVGTGLLIRSQANKNFDKYKSAMSVESADNFFEKSEKQGRLSNILIVAGIAGWVGDIIYVAVKGNKNKKEKEKLINGSVAKLGITFDTTFPNATTPLITFRKRF